MTDAIQSSPCLRRIALYGLSADPPTGNGGHVGIVRALAALPTIDEVHILPVYRHTYQHKQQRLVSFEHRWNMCQRAFAGISSKVVISDAEYHSWCHAVKGLSKEQASEVSVGTAALLEYLLSSSSSPTEYYYFCLGADAFLDLLAGKWKESQRVLELLQGRFVVFYRHVTENAELEDKVKETVGAQLLPVDSLTDVSSSQVRQCSDENKLAEMIVPSVLDYIKANKLYQYQETR